VKLLLNTLVTFVLFEGAEFIDLRVMTGDGYLRLEVVSPHDSRGRGKRHLTPAAELDRQLIRDLSDRSGRDGNTVWCELDGSWHVLPG
jgi:hypothetical protein